ncbi:zinc finger protein ZPR1 [Neocloeon triangulifer]|uniref:zinc finger protein ZPR1 n=1 Tax=Neocloeon triangulifer TaxID=2078957 RepID=UPI00286F2A14|nr:zinc finger protein ZPR1 [Neocloeon triangulifer]XP_059477371.1 zinc finger protein ZPR1 [Neocloeon triangulifer]
MTEADVDKTEVLFRTLNADDPEATEIESLCMECGENGMTRLLLTKIPFYKEVVIMSFACDFCGFRNNELQSGGKIEEQGVEITLICDSPKDLNRQVVKSDYTSIKIAELEFEIPAQSQKGEVTTVEGILDRSVQGLEQDQPLRRIQDPEGAKQIEEFVEKFKSLRGQKFTMIFEDISGNCFVENPNAPATDPGTTHKYFTRTTEQDAILGIYMEETTPAMSDKDPSDVLLELQSEVLQFGTNCPECNVPCITNMKLTNIPHFKEVVIMATNCDACGHRTNEVKSGGGIEPTGIRIEISIKELMDLKRDVLKSDTCDMQVPELDLEVGPHALGGRFSTVEGLLVAMKEQLLAHWGDSATESTSVKYQDFLDKMDQALEAKLPITLILDDPAGNSYIQSLQDSVEENVKVTRYERSHEQNEDLGLNHIKTEDYHEEN